MNKCTNCGSRGSRAINHHLHGRDGSYPDLCDVCYWRRKAEEPPMESLMVLADIRKAVGDPTGKLMQDELVERIDEKFNGVCEWTKAKTFNSSFWTQCEWIIVDRELPAVYCPQCGRKIKRR